MFPCESDLKLYTAKRLPQWALAMRTEKAAKTPESWAPPNLIDVCVNAHANVRATRGELAANNMMALIGRRLLAAAPPSAIVARLLDFADRYERQAKQPGRAGMGDKRMAGFARKWARKLSRAVA